MPRTGLLAVAVAAFVNHAGYGVLWHERGNMRLYLLCLAALWCLTQNVSVAADSTDAELSETARLLAILLDSGRLAIGRFV